MKKSTIVIALVIGAICFKSINAVIEEQAREAKYKKILEEFRAEQKEKEQEISEEERERQREKARAEREEYRQQIRSVLKSDPARGVKMAINNMYGYSDLVSMIGRPNKIDYYINDTQLAVWHIDDVTVHVSETKQGTTNVYAFTGNSVSNKIASKDFYYHLIN